jgi:hypothetical protein
VVPNADEIVSSWQASRRGRIGEVLNYVQQMPDPKWLTEDPGYPALREFADAADDVFSGPAPSDSDD